MMNKRFWRGFMAVMLGLTLLLGPGGSTPALIARAAEGESETASQPIESVQPVVEGTTPDTPVEGTTPKEPVEGTTPKEPVEGTTPKEPVEGTTPKEPVEGTTPIVPVEDGTPSGTTGDDKLEGEKKAEKKITYVAGNNSVSVKTAVGSKIPSLSAVGLNAPEGKSFVCWGTSEAGGTMYQAGGKFSSDINKLPSTLYAHWVNVEAEEETSLEDTVPEAGDKQLTGNGTTPTEGDKLTGDGGIVLDLSSGKAPVEGDRPAENGGLRPSKNPLFKRREAGSCCI